MFTINSLHPLFAAEVIGLDLSAGPPQAEMAEIQRAFARHSVLIFRDQKVDDAQQVAFSKCFGELDTT